MESNFLDYYLLLSICCLKTEVEIQQQCLTRLTSFKAFWCLMPNKQRRGLWVDSVSMPYSQSQFGQIFPFP